MVDDEDYEWLMQWNWQALIKARTQYANRGVLVNDNIGKRILSMHRMIMCLSDTKMQIDHIDHNGLNNQRSNLRIVTSMQNQQNMRSQLNHSSIYIGVSWCRFYNKWRATINFNKRHIHIGRYNTEEEAARARDKKSIELFGENANLNFK